MLLIQRLATRQAIKCFLAKAIAIAIAIQAS